MSVLSLNFGQCGNQIGQSLYTTLEEDITLKSRNSQHYFQSLAKWFNVDSKGHWKARSILVDTETKVIKDIKKSWFENIIIKPVGGSANNWAYGYVENSKLVVEQVLNLVRKELELSDLVTSFLNFYSLSGGTGSGVGSYVIEKLREEYPKNTIVNCAVLPYVKGEISTQAYNCLLNLSTLYSIGNCTVLFENERLLHLSKYSLNLNTVTYSNINSIISHQLASTFQPIGTVTTSSLLQNLISHPLFKFLQIRTEPNISNQNSVFEIPLRSTALINNLLRQSRFDHTQTNKYSDFKVISKALIHRGLENVPEYELKSLKKTRDLVEWLPQEESVQVYSVPERFLNNPCQWTENDKLDLLLALHAHGHRIAMLETALPHKSIIDIQSAINFYKSAAEAERKPHIITKWLQILRHLQGINAVTVLSSRALKYIAMFEEKTKSDVDLNEAMMFLSKLANSKPSAELSNATGYFLLQVLKKLAETTKFKNLETGELEGYFKELRDIDKLKANDVTSNPLRVPKDLLKFKAEEKK